MNPSKHIKSSCQGLGVRQLFQGTRVDQGYLRDHLDMIPETLNFYSILGVLITPMNNKYNVWILIFIKRLHLTYSLEFSDTRPWQH